MATSYPGPVQVGSYFVGQYYHVLQQQPDLVHQFYSDASTMIRVDGDSSESASATLQIHSMVMSLNFTAIEIKTINSLDSWNGGVLVMVSGSVKIKDFNGRRKFVQTFLLAPQEKGYFVLNDIFQFIDDGMIYQHPASTLQENKLDAQLNVSSPVAEPPATAGKLFSNFKGKFLLQAVAFFSDYVLEEDAREYVNSVHIEDDPIDKYSLPEQPPDEVVEAEVVVEEAPAEEALASHHSGVNTVQEPPAMPLEEPVAEPARRTYAAIVSTPQLLFMQAV
ncbi:Nuclear transport factor 2 domain - like 1 [Theobroma cacao]|nr:Nuclear transport factor 2 domain - like 1 [Theobroma cacao]